MIKHIKRVLRLKGHKMFLASTEFENVSIMVTKAKVKRLISNREFIYKIKEINTDFKTAQTVITWSK